MIELRTKRVRDKYPPRIYPRQPFSGTATLSGRILARSASVGQFSWNLDYADITLATVEIGIGKMGLAEKLNM